MLTGYFSGARWQLGFPAERMDELKVTGVAMAPSLTSRAVGIAIREDCNVILTVDELDGFDERGEMLSAMFKRDIYHLALGSSWFGKEGIHHLANVLSMNPSLIYRTSNGVLLSSAVDVNLMASLHRLTSGMVLYRSGDDPLEFEQIRSIGLNTSCDDLEIVTSMDESSLHSSSRHVAFVPHSTLVFEVLREVQREFYTSERVSVVMVEPRYKRGVFLDNTSR